MNALLTHTPETTVPFYTENKPTSWSGPRISIQLNEKLNLLIIRGSLVDEKQRVHFENSIATLKKYFQNNDLLNVYVELDKADFVSSTMLFPMYHMLNKATQKDSDVAVYWNPGTNYDIYNLGIEAREMLDCHFLFFGQQK